ncbi:4-carboxymuconolactone decarboxylase [Bradyrhizobium sp. GM5.1]
MRLPILDPKDLSAEQKPLYDDMRAGIKDHFKGFVNMRDDGALLGPWNPWIREPRFGKPVWELVKAIAANPLLPAPVREVAILVTGSHFRSGYELYAHVLVAEQRGLSDEKLATIVAGQRPVDLTKQEAVTYDVASALVSGGVLPELTYRAAVKEFGEHGAAELSYLVGVYCNGVGHAEHVRRAGAGLTTLPQLLDWTEASRYPAAAMAMHSPVTIEVQ